MSRDAATVLVVDDDASVRKALTRLIQSAGLKVKAFASAREFLDQAPPEGLACLVLDVRMPGLNGLDLQAEMTARNLQTPIIFLTGHGDVPLSVKAMKGGALDFLTKPFKDKDLLGVIKEALQKDARLQVAQMEKAEIQGRIRSLTPREREVLFLVVKGKMNKEIADALGTAERTVKVHRGRVMHKMQVQSVAELVRTVARVQAEGASPDAGTTKG
jgi:FixJ family two-component response regulator